MLLLQKVVRMCIGGKKINQNIQRTGMSNGKVEFILSGARLLYMFQRKQNFGRLSLLIKNHREN